MVSITRLLLILMLQCACFACGDHVTTLGDEVIAFKRLRGNPNSQGLALEVGSNEVTSDLESTKHADHREAKLATENMQAVQLKTEMTGSVENSTRATNNSSVTNAAAPPPLKSSPPPSPPIDSSKTNSTGNPATNTTTTVSPPPPANESKSPPVQACDHGPVIGKFVPAGGEDGPHDSTLTVKNAGKSKLELFIQASNGWKATPRVLTLSRGQNESVTVSVTDNEAAKHEAKITITWSDGHCYVNVPAQTVPAQNVPAGHASNSLAFLNEPEAFALLLGGSLVFLLVLGVAGVWGCISWRARARRHGDAEAKYQELEMTIAAPDAKQGDEGSPSADGWDEVWEDDDWQDTEAVRTSSTALTLSSAGLNSRRANKDGWDSSWDD